MLSILIPTYNYNVFSLVNELQKQAKETGIEFEILVLDDGSKLFLPENQEINSLEKCSFEILKENIGRSAIRNLLAKKATFDNLLYLDSDTIPVANDFISNYLLFINDEEKIVYGGITYQKEKPTKSQLLRWEYGKSRESLSVNKRKLNPYLRLLTLNFMIKKSVFEKVSFNETIPNLRHEDTLFSYNLKQQNISIQHINNPVIHLGLDVFEVAIKKENESLIALKFLIENQLLPRDYIGLSKLYYGVQKMRLIPLLKIFHKLTKSLFLRNLGSNNPSLIVFDLYRLGYYSSLY
jgi:glycosyltransferase involved in cell wall biosynthesis